MSARETRRLAAVLAADAAGFSRLMEADEAATLNALRSARDDVFAPEIARYGGRIVKTTGDGLLVEFPSAVDAVRCAVVVQQALVDQADAIVFRIGINLGDVVVERDDIFGDGVNVADRLQAIADPGGIAIAGNVHEQIAGRVDVPFADGGDVRLKNIGRPVRVWRWLPEGAADPRGAATARGDNPVVVVLPFTSGGSDGEVAELADGLTGDLTLALARRRGIEVIARSAAAGLAVQAGDLGALRQASGADYALAGSLRRHGARLRVAAELVETGHGTPLWSERYDYDWGDSFALADELTERIAAATRSAMNAFDGRRYRDEVDGLTNAQRRAKAAELFFRFTPASFAAAERLLDDVLANDADDAMANAMQAFCLMLQSKFELRPIEPDVRARALALAARAVELDRASDYAYENRGLLALHLRGDCQAAINDARQALSLSPQYPLAYQLLGEALIYSGDADEGMTHVRRALAAESRDPTNFYRHGLLAVGHFVAGDDAAALDEIEHALSGALSLPDQDLIKAAVLARLGRRETARAVIDGLRTRWPDVTLATLPLPPFGQAVHRERFATALRDAGLPA